MKKYKLHLLRIRKEDVDQYITLTPYAKVIEMNEIGKIILEESKEYDCIDNVIDSLCQKMIGDKESIKNDILEFYEKMKICGIYEEY